MSLGKILDISKNSLAVYQKALGVTTNNISNANNTDYTRQTVVFGTEQSNGDVGSGVKIADILRAKDNLVDKQLQTYNSKYAAADENSTILSQVESLAQEPSDNGISAYLTAFYNSWDELASNPSSTALRLGVTQAATNLTNKFQGLYEGLTQIKDDLVGELKTDIQSLNKSLSGIQDLNVQIFQAATVGQDASGLKDERDRLVNDISKLANVNVTNNDAGDVNISIGGVYAVDRFSHMEFQINQKDGKLSVGTVGGDAQMQLSGGQMQAMTELYNDTIPGYLSQLDDIAQSLVTNVNDIHSKGTTLNGDTGVNFFENYSEGKLSINAQILKDQSNIAVSSDGTTGNGDIAVKLAGLKDANVLNGKTISENYTTLISNIGSDKALSDQNGTANKLVLDQLQSQRDSVSGVSMDEEMTNVIRFQRSYDASAKLIKISDEMLQTLIDMV